MEDLEEVVVVKKVVEELEVIIVPVRVVEVNKEKHEEGI